MKTAEIHLPYFKQGDDLAWQLEHTSSNEDALENHACLLEDAARILRSVKTIITGQSGVTLDADTHMIWVSGEEGLIDTLIKEELAQSDPFEDEYEEEEEDDEDDEEYEESEDLPEENDRRTS